MEFLNQWGIAVILWVQSINPGLDPFFTIVNLLQTEEFFLIALPIVFWCVNKRLGATLTILFLTSDYIVRLLKGIAGVERPYDVDAHIRNLDPQTDLSFPSAGAMDTVVFWAFLATQLKQRAFWIWSILVICLLAFTRVYLGVHYPVDVIASLVIGTVIIALVLGLAIPSRIAALSHLTRWALAVGFPVILATLRLNAETAVTTGAMLGFGVGLLLEAQHVRFDPHTVWQKQALKIVIGLLIGLGLRIALKPLLPAGDTFTLARYSIIGLWMGVGAPWVFVLAHLSTAGDESALRTRVASA